MDITETSLTAVSFLLHFTEAQSQEMVKKYHIFMMKSGRINMCGLTAKNLDYVADAINDVVTTCQGQQQQQQGRL